LAIRIIRRILFSCGMAVVPRPLELLDTPVTMHGFLRRLYFLLPDVPTAKKIVDELLLAHVEWKHIHLLAKEGIPLEDLPQAGLSQKSDVVPALQRGIGVGAATGLLAGLVGMAFPPAGLTLAGGALLATTAAGAGFGALMSTMVGADIPNSRLERFRGAIDEGQLLMLVDLPRARVEEIEALVKSHHPDADIEGTDPSVPVFP